MSINTKIAAAVAAGTLAVGGVVGAVAANASGSDDSQAGASSSAPGQPGSNSSGEGPGAGGQQGGPGDMAATLAEALGVEESEVTAILEANKPDGQSGEKPDQSALVTALAEGLNLSTAKVEAALESAMPSGGPGGQPGGQQGGQQDSDSGQTSSS